MSQPERRFIAADNIEIEERGEGAGQPTVRGYAARFNVLSKDLGGFREQLAPGCFRNALSTDAVNGEQDWKGLVNHDPNLLVARSNNGSLALRQDGTGLYHEATPIDTTAGTDLIKNVRAKNITQMSFGFTVPKDGQSWEDQGGQLVRTVRMIDRGYDVSWVTYPAYSGTSVGMRSEIAAAGIDVSRWLSMEIRAEHGLNFSQDDLSFLRDANKRINDLIVRAENSDKTSEDNSVEIQAMRLRILKLGS